MSVSQQSRLAKAAGFGELRTMKAVADLVATFGLVAICVVAPIVHPLLLIVPFVLVPPLALRLWGLGHEASHGLLARTRWVNDFFGLVCDGMALVPFYGWRAGHLSHHVNNDHPIREEYSSITSFKFFQRRQNARARGRQGRTSWLTPAIKLFGLTAATCAYTIGFRRSHTARRGLLLHRFEAPGLRVLNMAFPLTFWAIYIAVTVIAPLYAVLGIWIPLFVGHGLIAIVGFLNHQDMQGRIQYRFKSSHEIRSGQSIDVHYGLLNWFVVGIGDEHTVHHRMPFIPWYKLRAARKAIEAQGMAFPRMLAPGSAWRILPSFLRSQLRVARIDGGYEIRRTLAANTRLVHNDGAHVMESNVSDGRSHPPT